MEKVKEPRGEEEKELMVARRWLGKECGPRREGFWIKRVLRGENPDPYDGLGPDLPTETPSGHQWRTAGQAQEKKDFPSAGTARTWRPGTQMFLLVTAQ